MPHRAGLCTSDPRRAYWAEGREHTGDVGLAELLEANQQVLVPENRDLRLFSHTDMPSVPVWNSIVRTSYLALRKAGPAMFPPCSAGSASPPPEMTLVDSNGMWNPCACRRCDGPVGCACHRPGCCKAGGEHGIAIRHLVRCLALYSHTLPVECRMSPVRVDGSLISQPYPCECAFVNDVIERQDFHEIGHFRWLIRCLSNRYSDISLILLASEDTPYTRAGVKDYDASCGRISARPEDVQTLPRYCDLIMPALKLPLHSMIRFSEEPAI
jgi:hypothetical protein